MNNRETLAYILGKPTLSVQEVAQMLGTTEQYITFANSHALAKLVKTALEVREEQITRRVEKERRLAKESVTSLDDAVFEALSLYIDNVPEALENVLRIFDMIEDPDKREEKLKQWVNQGLSTFLGRTLLGQANITGLVRHYTTKLEEKRRYEREEAEADNRNPCALSSDPCLTDAERQR